MKESDTMFPNNLLPMLVVSSGDFAVEINDKTITINLRKHFKFLDNHLCSYYTIEGNESTADNNTVLSKKKVKLPKEEFSLIAEQCFSFEELAESLWSYND